MVTPSAESVPPRINEFVTVSGVVRTVESLFPEGHYRITVDVPPENPAVTRLRERIARAVENGYTEGDVNHNVQPIIGHMRMLLRDGKPMLLDDMEHYVNKLLDACDAETAWLNTTVTAPAEASES